MSCLKPYSYKLFILLVLFSALFISVADFHYWLGELCYNCHCIVYSLASFPIALHFYLQYQMFRKICNFILSCQDKASYYTE